MNLATFDDCLAAYLHHCETTDWVKAESYKFFFANWLFSKVNLGLQQDEKILGLCKEALKEDYSLGREPSVTGVQFLQKAGYDQISVAITVEDVQIMKYLRENEIPDKDFFETRGMSYTGLTGWLGTLIPKKFMPVVVTYFSESIRYLFDLGDDFPKSGYKYFIEGQRRFKQTKEALIGNDIPQHFLERINAYRVQARLGEQKKKYNDVDWNWVVQDFHLFTHRERLKLWAPKTRSAKKEPPVPAPEPVPSSTQPEPAPEPAPSWAPYDLQPIQPPHLTPDHENRGLTFTPDHYLEKYKNQLAKGTRCEDWVRDKEIERLRSCADPSLADCVRIVSVNPDLGYDIESRETDGTPMQIEVKAIPGDNPKSFYISVNELEKSATLPNYYIYCVYEGEGEPKIYILKHPNLQDQTYFIAEPLVFRVSFI